MSGMISEVANTGRDEKPSQAVVSWAYAGLFLVLSVSFAIKSILSKHLSLDGIGYFFLVLENQTFAGVAWSRRFTEYLTEWPLVLMVQTGVTDLDFLSGAFAFGIYLPYLISFGICWYAVRDEDKNLLWFPLAGYIGFNILSDYDLIADHHVLAQMTWPILFLLVKTRPLQWIEGLLLCLLLVAYTRMYETVVLTGLVLVAIGLGRLYWYRVRQEQVIIGIVLVLLVIAVYIGIQYIVDPRSPQNRGAFLDSIWVNRRNWEAVSTNLFLLLIGCGWVVSSKFKVMKMTAILLSLVPIAVYVYLRLVYPDYAMTAYLSFSSRTLIGLVVPGLMIGCVIVVVMKARIPLFGVGVFVVGFTTMTAFNLSDLRHWNQVRAEFSHAMESDELFVSVDDTPLGDPGLDLRHYRWSWNNSLLSLVWSGDCVRTIILNSPGDPQGPIDPRRTLAFKRYLKYAQGFKAVDPKVRICD
jgi:hypothetical protein